MPAKLPPGQLTKKQQRVLRRRPRKSGRATVKNSNTSAKAQKRLENIALVLELRRSGYTFEIGKQIGVHLTTARDMWLDGADAVVREPAEKLLAMELDRLDEMQASIYTKAARGNQAAIERVLRIMDQRAKFLGLYPDSKRATRENPNSTPPVGGPSLPLFTPDRPIIIPLIFSKEKSLTLPKAPEGAPTIEKAAEEEEVA
jgi:hypothetical protein